MITINILIYIDPGSGSMILQAIIAGFLGIAMFFKNIKMYLLQLFKKNKNDDSKIADEINNLDDRK